MAVCNLCCGQEAQDFNTTVSFSHDSSFSYMPHRKAEAMKGEVGLMEAEQECAAEVKVFGKLPIQFSVGSEYVGINENVPLDLPSHLTGVTTDIETTLPFFGVKNTHIRFGVSPSWYGDSWDFDAASFRIPSRYMVIYQPSPRLTLVGGVEVYPDFEDEISPIIGCIYEPNDQWKLYLAAPRPYLSYSPMSWLSLFLEGGVRYGEYEVDKEEHTNTVLRYKKISAGAGFQLKPNKNIRASLSVGGAFKRNLKYLDSLGKVNIQNGLYTEARVEVKL